MTNYLPFRIIREYFSNKATASDEMLMRAWISEKHQNEQLYNALISLHHARYSMLRLSAYWAAFVRLIDNIKQFDRRTWLPILKLVILMLFVK